MVENFKKYFNNQLTSSQKNTLFKQFDERKADKIEFEKAEKVFLLTSLLSEPGDAAVGELAFRRFQRKRMRQKGVQYFRKSIGYVATIAASVVFTYGVMSYYLSSQSSKSIVMNELYVPAGQRAMIKLSDSTEVWVNSNSTLSYPSHFTGENRKVHLSGEAFFSVQRNEKIPFIVSTQKQEIKVLGTEFNLFAYEGKTVRTALLNGSVEISSPFLKRPIMLEPNHMAMVSDTTCRVRRFRSHDFLLWKKGIYVFNDNTFKEIAQKLELYYDVTFIFKNHISREFRFTGKFRQRDGIDNALRLLQRSTPFRYHKDDAKNQITIY